MEYKKMSETSQVFEIECAGMQITETLLKGLLRDYFNIIRRNIPDIVVFEIKKPN